MTRTSHLTTLTLVALGAALVSTAALADRGGMGDRMGMGGRGGLAMFDFAAVDADKDGKITEAELTAYRAAEAKAADTDGDGLMNADELAAMHLKGMTARAAEMAAEMVKRLDTDADGKLSAVEMAVRPAPAALFDRIDADGDGAVTEAEITAAKEKMAQRMQDRKGRRGNHDSH